MTIEEKRERRRIWRAKNKEKTAIYRKKTYEKLKNNAEFKEKKKKADKAYRDKNKDKKRIADKNYRNRTKEKRKIYDSERYEKLKNDVEYKESRKEYHKKYYIENKEKVKVYSINNREERNIRERKRYKEDPVYRISRLLISNIKKGFIRNKKSRTTDILGCNYKEFKLYLESKFEPWMTWENWGLYNGELNYGWDIDHIVPLSSAKCEEEIVKLNHYTNLRPLCSKINRYIKKDKI